MILTLDIENKTIGNKELFKGLNFTIEQKEKVAVIGRNGVGKSTLFKMLDGKDIDYTGNIQFQRGTRIVSTAQEHHGLGDESVVQYILDSLPEYKNLKHIIDTYPQTMNANINKIGVYTNALERFNQLDYYTIEDEIYRSLEGYQISKSMAESKISKLSGGQKRFVELVIVEHSNADVDLIDEPTNHMDYVAKAFFIEWLKSSQQTVLVITHDRDVLGTVDKIIEIKNGRAFTFKGNYKAYLQQNAQNTAAKINDYQIDLKTLDNLHKQIMWARARKPSWHGTADQRNPFEVMERRLQKKYDQINNNMEKPSFWIDRESISELPKKMNENYEKYKSKNIRIHKSQISVDSTELIEIENLQLGYTNTPLFRPLNFSLKQGQRLDLVGRNGVGKTTLIRAILNSYKNNMLPTLLSGKILCNSKLRLSAYEQEVETLSMNKSLDETIEDLYNELDLKVSNEIVKRILSDNLFDPNQDGRLTIEQLSGGQKARIQIIKMLANNPNLLILDEPTNHLDLPSIEELENALINYRGAILYVSHDSYFANNIGGDKLVLQPH